MELNNFRTQSSSVQCSNKHIRNSSPLPIYLIIYDHKHVVCPQVLLFVPPMASESLRA